MKGNKILLKLLRNSGVKYISGIVGREGEHILFEDQEDIDFILVRHEQTSGIASEVCARKSKKVQACFCTIGPGVTNMATGVASAYKDGSPLIAIGMQVERVCRDEIVHQYIDNVSIMKPITKYAVEPNTIEELIENFKKFPQYLYEGKPGPVFVSLCIDLLNEDYPDIKEEDLFIEEYNYETEYSDECKLNNLYEMIKQSKQPIILAGREALDYSELIQEFSHKYNIPIGTSLAGKGVIPESEELSIGAVTKYWDKFIKCGILKKLFEKVDLILLIGFDYSEDLTQNIWQFGEKKKVCKIGKVTSNEIKYFEIDGEISGNIAETMNYLLSKDVIIKENNINIKEIKKIKNDNIDKIGECVNTFRVLKEIRKRLKSDDNLVSDVGLHKHITALYYDVLKPNTFFSSNGLATMGFGLPAGIGTFLADQTHKTVVVCGDGSFHSVSQDLATCNKYKIPLIIVLFKDDAYGLIRHYQYKGNGKFDDSSTCFSSVDFSMLAKANGCEGYKANTIEEFIEKFELALKGDVATLIEIPIKYTEN